MSIDLDGFWQSLAKAQVDISNLNTSELASVLIAITDSKHDPKLILTRRAESMNTHSGQVAFPGGRWEAGDPSLAYTALRESKEEIALSPDVVEIKGMLQARKSYFGLWVYPFVARVPEVLDLKKNPAEIDSIFTVPLRFFLETEPSRVDKVERQGVRYQVPAWYFEDYEIWGLTAFILQDMLSLLSFEQKPSTDLT